MCFEIDEINMVWVSLSFYVSLVHFLLSFLDEVFFRVNIPFFTEILISLGIVICIKLPNILNCQLMAQKLETITAPRLIKKMRMIQSILLDRNEFEETIFNRKYRKLIIQIISFLETFKNRNKHYSMNYLQSLEEGEVLYDPKTNSEIIVEYKVTPVQ